MLAQEDLPVAAMVVVATLAGVVSAAAVMAVVAGTAVAAGMTRLVAADHGTAKSARATGRAPRARPTALQARRVASSAASPSQQEQEVVRAVALAVDTEQFLVCRRVCAFV